MKKIKIYAGALIVSLLGMTACTDLDEEVFDRVDASVYYQDENSIKGAISAVYASAAAGFLEYFWYMNEFSADQVTWRTWNGGQWGWDEANKFVLSSQTWNSESLIINQAWQKAWTTIGLCNNIINDLESIDPASIKVDPVKYKEYIAEVRTMRAWAMYNNFELWGGSLPINTKAGGEVNGSAGEDFDSGCREIFKFISDELDLACPDMILESGNTRTRLTQGMNRMLKMRLLLNAEVLIGEAHFDECETLAREIINGDYGNYQLATDYRQIFSYGNEKCAEIVFAFAEERGKLSNNNRNTPFLPYNYFDFVGGTYESSGWNCICLVPSFDNYGVVLPDGGTDNPRSFVTYYGDKLGAIYERFNDKDIRKKPFHCDASGNWEGIFLIGAQKDYNTGDAVLADADREGEPLVYVDQLGTFKNLGRSLETVMSPRWGETNSGYRLLKYPIYPEAYGVDFVNISEVEFRLAEAYYTLAECLMRKGLTDDAKEWVNKVYSRYFTDKSAVNTPGKGFDAFDMDWMLSQWGVEFLNEGRRRRMDLRRFDKFTQGQWWFYGRATEDGYDLPAKRDRKYEWFPLPATAIMVNSGLRQVPNY